MAEPLVGDITPFDGVTKAEKRQRESDAMRHMVALDKSRFQKMLALWQEYEEHVSLESQWVHNLDKLKLVAQIVEYEISGNLDLGDFAYVTKKVTAEGACNLTQKILQKREEFWDGKEHKQGELDGGAETSVRREQDRYYQS